MAIILGATVNRTQRNESRLQSLVYRCETNWAGQRRPEKHVFQRLGYTACSGAWKIADCHKPLRIQTRPFLHSDCRDGAKRTTPYVVRR